MIGWFSGWFSSGCRGCGQRSRSCRRLWCRSRSNREWCSGGCWCWRSRAWSMRRRNGRYRRITRQHGAILTSMKVGIVVHLAHQRGRLVAVHETVARYSIVHQRGESIVGVDVQAVEFREHRVLIQSTLAVVTLRTKYSHAFAATIVTAGNLEQRRMIAVNHNTIAIETAGNATFHIDWAMYDARAASSAMIVAGVVERPRICRIRLTLHGTVATFIAQH